MERFGGDGLFLGEHRHALDEKGRVIFPARMRDDLGAQVVLQKGIDPCVYVFPPDEWDRQVANVTALPTTKPEARRYARFFFSQAQGERVDKQGRLTVPQSFREYAGLQRDVVVVGAGPRIEIWDSTRWDAHRAEAESNVEEFSSELGI
ncbi:MAG: division/cell wall cluster transcriptional repressor MraZ [Actinomycetota bacterium]